MRLTQHGTRTRRPARARGTLVALAAAATVAALALGGCAPGVPAPKRSGPAASARSASDVTADLKKLPGVTEAEVSYGTDGLPGRVRLSVGLNLDAGYAGDLAALLDYALAQAWSQTDTEPTTVASIGFLRGGADVDLNPAAAELGWTDTDGLPLTIGVAALAERYGPWPGPVPRTLP